MKSQLQKKVYVAMSGGVDSSVAAALLKEAATPKDFEKIFGRPWASAPGFSPTPRGFRGFDVRGIHMKMWSPTPNSERGLSRDRIKGAEPPSAYGNSDGGVDKRIGAGQADPYFPVCRRQYEDRLDAARAAAHLGIPFETWDFTKEYKKWVVDYMVREYAAGRTPNPDVMCNRHIKFGFFLKRALKRGADFVATGHYVRLAPEFPISNFQFSNKSGKSFKNCNIENSLKTENYKLKIAKDFNKDQSYFLWTFTQNQLEHCLFPIGEYTKPEVREVARKFGLPTAEKAESQGVCFIGEFDMKEFLKKRIPESRGPVVTTSGKKVGEHEGLSFYTIGERHGLGIGGGIPFYVTAKDFKKNTLVVGEGPYDKKLFRKELIATNVNWISGKEPKFPLKCEARIRYRQSLQKCTVRKLQTTNYKLQTIFDEPQRAVTPGQSIVFYKSDEMLGGGIIE